MGSPAAKERNTISMGACGTKVSPNDGGGKVLTSQQKSALKNIDKKLDEEMKAAAAEERAEINLLLLGAGESGKTTFRKQMRIIHGPEEAQFTAEELQTYRNAVYKNIFEGLSFLIRSVNAYGEKKLEGNLKEVAEEIEIISVDDDDPDIYDEALAVCATTMWESVEIQSILKRANELKLNNVTVNMDSLPYFMANISRICSKGYVPTQQDILNSRSQTITVEEETFLYKNTKFRIIDVGGQRNERKKWLPLFERVTGFMFFASLVEYDQFLAEDKEENRMKESLNIFGAVCNYYNAENPPPIILFLNKKDLLETKVLSVDLNIVFPEYTGGLNYDNALEFIKNKYMEQNRGNRKIYSFVTCATNTSNVKFVFKTCGDIILKENLKKSGMYAHSDIESDVK